MRADSGGADGGARERHVEQKAQTENTPSAFASGVPPLSLCATMGAPRHEPEPEPEPEPEQARERPAMTDDRAVQVLQNAFRKKLSRRTANNLRVIRDLGLALGMPQSDEKKVSRWGEM